jgi:GrpB-like predicted nucleotidyltransferase (UPF0157 family)
MSLSITNKKQQPIEVISYDPNWPSLFQMEAKLLTKIFTNHVVAIHHVGSTAIPHMPAKPTIDIVLVVDDITQVDQYNEAMAQHAYEAIGLKNWKIHNSGADFSD